MEALYRFDYEKAISVIEVIRDSVEVSLRECPAVYQDAVTLEKTEEIYVKLQDLKDYLLSNI